MPSNTQGSSGLFSTNFATTGALALAFAASRYVMANRPESKRKSERPAQEPTQESPEVLAERLRRQEEKSALETRLALLEQELTGLKKAQEASQKENTTLITQLKQAETKEKELSAQLVAAQKKSTSLESSLTDSKGQLSSLQAELAAKESQLIEANQTSANQAEQISTLTARAENAEANGTELSEQLEKVKAEQTLLEAEADNLRGSLENEQQRFTEEALQQQSGSRRGSYTARRSSSPALSCSSEQSFMSQFDSGSDAKIRVPACAKNKENQKAAKRAFCLLLMASTEGVALYGLKVLFDRVLGYKKPQDLERVFRLSSRNFTKEQKAEYDRLKASTDRISLYHEDDDFDRRSNASFSLFSNPKYHLTQAGTPPQHTGQRRFDFLQGRRDSAPALGQHSRFNSRASHVSLTPDQGEGRSHTSSFPRQG